MDDEKLILLVQANECLFNKYCPGYKLSEKKKNIWKQISLEMQIPEEICIKRWACLRDRYAREKRQLNLPSGSGAKHESHWHLMKTMEFIAAHIVPRATRCSYNILDIDKIDSATTIEINSHPTPPPSSQPSSGSSDSISSPLPDDLPRNVFTPIAPSPITSTVHKRKRTTSDSNDDNSFSEAIGVFKQLCKKKMEEKGEEKSPLHGFGQMIVSTIQSMSSVKQIKAMQRVTSVVMEMKLEPDD